MDWYEDKQPSKEEAFKKLIGRIHPGAVVLLHSTSKEWNCDITLIDTVDNGVIWHEILHSCSTSYYEPKIYHNNKKIEEASVEFLKQQICKEKGIIHLPAYVELTSILQVLNHTFQYGTDMEFAKKVYNIFLPERYQWLENTVDNSLRQAEASFEDYI